MSTTTADRRKRLETDRDIWAAIGGGNPHTLALAAQAAIDALDAEECPMCGWTPGTNPDNCGECAR